jgi:hypothetical protein
MTSSPHACRRLAISPAERIDQLVTDAVLARLSSKKAQRLLDRSEEPARAKAAKELADASARMEEVAADYGSGAIGREEWEAFREPARLRAERARAELAALSPDDLNVPPAATIAARWEELTLAQRRAVLGKLIDAVVIAPARAGLSGFDYDRIAIRWRA